MRSLYFILTFFLLMHFADAQAIVAETIVNTSTTAPQQGCDPITSRILYEVKKGDNLVKILKTFKLAPLWCKGCSIQSTASLNKLRDKNLIFENQQIELPFRCEGDLASFEFIQKNNERFILNSNRVTLIRETASAEAGPVAGKDFAVAMASEATPRPLSPANAPLAPITTFEEARTSDLRIAGIYGFHSIYATEIADGSHASLASTPTYGLAVGWRIPWSEDWSSNFGLAQRFVQFRKASVGTIQDSGNNIGGFSAGFERTWTRTHLHFDVGAEQALAVRSSGAQAVVLDPITVPFAEVSIDQILHQSGPFELSANVAYRFLGSAKTDSYEVQSGASYGGGFAVSQQLEKMKIDVRVGFKNEFQNSTIVEHDVKHLEMQIGVTIPLGGGSSSLKAVPR